MMMACGQLHPRSSSPTSANWRPPGPRRGVLAGASLPSAHAWWSSPADTPGLGQPGTEPGPRRWSCTTGVRWRRRRSAGERVPPTHRVCWRCGRDRVWRLRCARPVACRRSCSSTEPGGTTRGEPAWPSTSELCWICRRSESPIAPCLRRACGRRTVAAPPLRCCWTGRWSGCGCGPAPARGRWPSTAGGAATSTRPSRPFAEPVLGIALPSRCVMRGGSPEPLAPKAPSWPTEALGQAFTG